MNKYEATIKELKEICDLLQEQSDLKDSIIEDKKREVKILKDKISILEKSNKELVDAGNKWEQTCNQLEELCFKQQELLESFLEDAKELHQSQKE